MLEPLLFFHAFSHALERCLKLKGDGKIGAARYLESCRSQHGLRWIHQGRSVGVQVVLCSSHSQLLRHQASFSCQRTVVVVVAHCLLDFVHELYTSDATFG